MNSLDGPTLIFTGGHHSSSLPLAQALIKSGWRVIWLGHKYSMWADRHVSAEYQEVTQSGIEFISLQAGKFYRSLHPGKLVRIPLGFLHAAYLLLGFKLKYGRRLRGIVSFGGYLAVPVVVCGWFLGLASVSHEQTVTTGWANRVIALFAKKIAVTWPTSLAHYTSGKAILTGLPLRPEIKAVKQSMSARSPAVSRPLIHITGGKQGSHLINTAIFTLLPVLLEKFDVSHQTGSSSLFNDFDHASKLSQQLPAHLRRHYRFAAYFSPSQVAEIFNRAAVVVSRAGAHIIYELAYLGIPSLLIPIPWSSHHEQDHNAGLLVDHHLAVVLPEVELSPDSLHQSLLQALKLPRQPLPVPDNALEKMVDLVNSTFA